jgi:transcriptional regulator with XRE-family HTH domain
MNKNEKLKKITADQPSNWLEEAAKKVANKGARKNARKVALRVLQLLRERGISQTELAEKMGVSRQQVTKIVKGQENFTFETIDKLEKALQVTLMTIGAPPGSSPEYSKPLNAMVKIPAANEFTQRITNLQVTLQKLSETMLGSGEVGSEHILSPFVISGDYKRMIDAAAFVRQSMGTLPEMRMMFKSAGAIKTRAGSEQYKIVDQDNLDYSMS